MIVHLRRLPLFPLVIVGLLAACGKSSDPQTAYEAGDYNRASELWLPLAESGDADAQNAIGTLYYLGQGYERNYLRAAEWFRKAAEQGNARAQRNLGMLYVDGRGVEQNYLLAYSWLYAADKQGNKSADAYINTMVNKLTPNQQIKARRMADQYIINPTADYVPTREVPQFEPQTEDLRDTEISTPDTNFSEAG